jgi:hypothetical protein
MKCNHLIGRQLLTGQWVFNSNDALFRPIGNCVLDWSLIAIWLHWLDSLSRTFRSIFQYPRSLNNLPHHLHSLPTQTRRRHIIRGFGKHTNDRLGITGADLHPAVGPVQA